MKSILKIFSAVGLILTVVPSFLVFSGAITLDMHKWLMLLGTIIWFFTAPFWMNKKAPVE
jgi:hypothetical protein